MSLMQIAEGTLVVLAVWVGGSLLVSGLALGGMWLWVRPRLRR